MFDITTDNLKRLGNTLRSRASGRIQPFRGLPPGPALWLMLIVSAGLWVGLVYGAGLIWHWLATFI
jgi:hypothetical protein